MIVNGLLGNLVVGGIPKYVAVDHNIENGEQLAHACGQGHLFVFSFSAEPVVEDLDERIETCGHEGGHVEGSSDRGTTSPDGSMATEGTAVTVERGDTDESSNLVTVEGP